MIVQPFPQFPTVLWPLLTSRSSLLLCAVSDDAYSCTPARPPRVRATTFTSYICCIYVANLGQYRTSFCFANSSTLRRLLCSSCSSDRGFARRVSSFPVIRLPSDSASRRTPLPLANSSYCQVCSGLSPPSRSPCRAHEYRASLPMYGREARFVSTIRVYFLPLMLPQPRAFPLWSASLRTGTSRR